MDNAVLKKKLSTFRSPKGSLTRVPDDILIEVVQTWEQWSGTSTDMAKELGVTMRQLVILVEKAKKVIRDGGYPMSDFKEVRVESSPSNLVSLQGGPCMGVEIMWDNGKLIRFQQVEQLIDFLKKVA
jgi:hypothetical protein